MVDKTKQELKKAILAPNGEVKMVDWGGAINLIGRDFGLISSLNLFSDRFGTQKNFFVTKSVEDDDVLLQDRNWETTRPTLAKEEYTGVTFPVGHFPVDDMIMPSDIDGVANFEMLVPGSELETLANVRERKLRRIRRAHAKIHEYARAYALATGKVYAPGGTLKTSYGTEVSVYQEWGIARGTAALDLSAGVNPLTSANDVFKELQGRAKSGDALSGYVVLAGKDLFQDLITNDYIADLFATAQLQGRQELLVDRLGNTLGLDARYRSFKYGGLTFVDASDVIGGQPIVAANKGIAFPMGAELGRMHFAPANRFDTINQVSQASYLWEQMAQDMTKLELKSETNFAAILDRPDLVIDVTYTK